MANERAPCVSAPEPPRNEPALRGGRIHRRYEIEVKMLSGSGREDPGAETSLLIAKLKEAATHTAIYGLGSALQVGLGFVLIPLYTRNYTAEMYGVLTLIILAGTIAGTIFYLGISSALARSFYDYAQEEGRRVVFSTSLYLSLLGAVLQALFAVVFGGTLSRLLFGSPQYELHIILALVSSALTFVNAVFYMLLRFQRRSKQVILLNLLTFVLTVGLIFYLLVSLRLGVLAPILGTLLGQVVLFGALLSISRTYVVWDWSKYEAWVQLKFGIPAVLVGLTYYVLDSIDRLFIKAYGSLSDVGVYSLGYKIGMLIQILLILPFSQIWAPMRMEYRNERHASRLFALVLSYYCMVGLLLAVTISVFSREVVGVVAGGGEYLPAYRVVPFVLLGHLAYGAINILDNGIMFQRKVIYHVYIFSVGLLINIMLNVLLIPRFGYMGAAYATLGSYIVVALLVAAVSNRLWPVPWELRRLAGVCASGVLALAIGTHVHPASVPIAVIAKAALLVGLVGVWGRFVLSPWERQQVISAFRRRVVRSGSDLAVGPDAEAAR